MKYYAFQILCLAAAGAFLKFRPWPGIIPVIVAGVFILGSVVLTAKGKSDAVDDMWWRIAIAIAAPLIIGLAGA